MELDSFSMVSNTFAVRISIFLFMALETQAILLSRDALIFESFTLSFWVSRGWLYLVPRTIIPSCFLIQRKICLSCLLVPQDKALSSPTSSQSPVATALKSRKDTVNVPYHQGALCPPSSLLLPVGFSIFSAELWIRTRALEGGGSLSMFSCL